jgi:spore maturation protein CgeB
MSRPRVLTLWLDTWYGTGKGESSDNMIFGHGLFDQLGFDETHVALESRGAVSGSYDLVFTVPYQKVLDLRAHGPVVAWMCDDVWRYPDFGKPWADVADLIVTTDPASAVLYGDKGLLSNWACRPEWHRLAPSVPGGLSASFQGQIHGLRRTVLAGIEKALLSDKACPIVLFVNDTGEELLTPEQYFAGISGSAFTICLTESSHRTRQMKSRLFEPQMFDSILVTEPVAGLEEYWEPGKECVVFRSAEECADQIRALVRSNAERTAMAQRARRRLYAEHTYQRRFAAVLDRMGVTVG